MANLATTTDCLDFMLKRIGEQDYGQGSRFEDNALLHLNIAQRELLSGTSRLAPQIVATFPWAKAQDEKSITMQPPYTTGTVSITKGVQTVNFSNPPTISLTNYHIRIGTNNTMYRITSHLQNNAQAVIDSPIVEATAAAETFVAFLIDYDVGSSDILRPVTPFIGFKDNSSGDETNQIDGISEFDFRRQFPVINQGEPTHFMVLRQNNGTYRLRFSHYVAATSKLWVPYIGLPSDLTADPDTTPVVPIQSRLTLCELGLFYLFQDKNDDRVANAFQSAQVGYQAMLREIGFTDLTFEPFKPNVEVKGA
jgi:hypothetical protein